MQGQKYILGIRIVIQSVLLLICSWSYSKAQELYPLSEPASTLGKNTLGVRIFSETYKEVDKVRNMTALRLMYGVTPRLTTYITGIASNHHGEKMPQDFPFHNTPERGAEYPYKFNGVHFYAKYRYLSIDKNKSHLRLAVYGEAAQVSTTHHETEPNLMMGDTKGWGGGIINTYLYKKFSASLTAGLIFPKYSEGLSPDPIVGLPDVGVRTHYGRSLTYNLSFGYLIYPKKYENYDQTNINLYLEFTGKAYEAAKVDLFIGTDREYYLHNSRYPTALQKGYYVDISPGIQFIVKSNLRIDASTTLQFINVSYAKVYSVYTLGLQYYFYL